MGTHAHSRYARSDAVEAALWAVWQVARWTGASLATEWFAARIWPALRRALHVAVIRLDLELREVRAQRRALFLIIVAIVAGNLMWLAAR